MTLKEYGEKRDFDHTPEPPLVPVARGEGPLVFVVQKHAARRLHYDFRLEVDGVFKSWSVPGGPSFDPKVKRLAVMVEDHPLEYGSFEGIIPKGEYGAGQVIVWDHGGYSPDDDGHLLFGDRAQAEERVREGLKKGKLSIFLRGYKLKGSWALVKMKRGENSWLLIKHQDNYADAGRDVLEEGSSVISGLTIEDLSAGRKPVAYPVNSAALSGITGSRRASLPKTLSPMLASVASAPFSHQDWLFEPKLDGYRTIAIIDNNNIYLRSRRNLDTTRKYASIAEALRFQPAGQMVLDGEIIALDAQGKLCFQCLQGYLSAMNRSERQSPEAAAIIYYVFDILYLDGYDLRKVPLNRRKEILKRVLVPSQQVRVLEHFEGDGLAIYRAAVEQGLEGVIAKEKSGVYESGRRSENWLKIKSTKTDDFIIGGYTRGTGNRARTLGALIIGYYDSRDRLVSAGHVGTGFDDRTLNDLKKRLDAIKTEQSPFTEVSEVNAPVTWVHPELVMEVKFSEWTRDGRLRSPVFVRLRDDKPAGDVRRTQSVITPGPERNAVPDRQDEDTVARIVGELRSPRNSLSLDVQGHRFDVSNLDKNLWPGGEGHPALTKRDLLIYLTRVSPYLLEHLKDRPLTLSRYPDGINGEQFFQKHWHDAVPEFVATAHLSERGHQHQEYVLCNNLPTLLWLGQVADLELHTWFSRLNPYPDAEIPGNLSEAESHDYLSQYPDFLVFDLDPYIYSGSEPEDAEPELSREGFTRAGEAALWLKETLDALSLSSFVKTSGRTGLHVYVPILRQLDYHAVHSAGKTICQFVRQRHPGALTIEWPVKQRTGKIFLDYNQNVRGKTLASVYSPRATPEATVSAPLRWDELDRTYPTDFTILTLPDRLAELGDLWEHIIEAKHDLKQLLKLS